MRTFFMLERRNKAVTAILLLMLPLGVFSQKIRFYNSERGLPNSWIHRVSQDDRGYIWLATENGTCYFDGIRFTTFRHDRAKEGTLLSDLVKVVYTDSRGNCWVGTSNGLQLFDNETNTFRDFPLQYQSFIDAYYISSIVETPDKSKLLVSVSGFGIIAVDAQTQTVDHETTDQLQAIYHEPYVGNLLFDSKGNLWSFSEQGNLFEFNYNQKTLQRNLWGDGVASLTPQLAVSAMAEDPETGNMLVGTFSNGLYVFDRKLGCVRKAKGALTSTAKYPIRSLLAEKVKLSTGELGIWVGTEGCGLKRFDRRSEEIQNPDFQNVPINLDNCKVHSLMQDTQGNLWAAIFQKGLIVVPKSTYGFDYLHLSNADDPSGQVQACATAIVRDLEGNLWVGTDGAGLVQVAKSGGVKRFTSQNSPLPNNAIISLAIDKRGTVWVTTYMGGITTYNPHEGFRTFSNDPELRKVNCLLYDKRDDKLYFGTLGSGVKVYSFADKTIETFPLGKSGGWIYSLCIDGHDVLWVGRSNGVRCYDTRTGEERNSQLYEKLSESRINSLLEHRDGTMWLGADNGLIHYVEGNRELQLFTKKDGLPSNLVSAIQQDANGVLWISTTNGLVRFNPQGNDFKRYYSYDGLQDNEFRPGTSFADSDGKLFFGGISGVSSFYPNKVDQWKPHMPNVYFSQLTVLNQSVNYDPLLGTHNILDSHISHAKQITIAKSQNVFSIEFAVLEYTNPQKVIYGYMMQGFDKDWRYAEPDKRSATYTNLPDGEYTFMVKAFFEGCSGGDEVVYNQINIIILPPWYKTWWAYIIYLAFFSLLAWALFYFLNRRRQLIHERLEFERKEMRLRMFTDLSHEIRTPLTLVMNPLKSMRESETDHKRKELFNLMYRNTLRILQLINQLMDMRKIDNDQLRIHFGQTDLIFFVSDIMKSFEHLALVRNIDFRLLSNRDALTVWLDQRNFDKVLYNILSNAFKFTPDNGYVHLTIDTLPNDRLSGLNTGIAEYVEIRLENSGGSIDESELERIFDRYYQRPDETGSGFGLHLAKMIVQLHHGTVVSKNTENGVAFVVRIPLGHAHLSADALAAEAKQNDLYPIVRSDEKLPKESDFIDMSEPDEDEAEAKVSKSKRTIVFIDDDVDLVRYIRLELSDLFNVEVCTDSVEAWKLISTTIPDAVVTDLVMPKVDGIALCRKIRQNLETNYLPVIILTGETDEESKRICIESGADSYLTKPISLEMLKTTITQAIQTRDLIRNKYRSHINPDFGEMQISSPDSRLIAKVIETIRKNIENPEFGVDELSREVGLSRVHLNRKLKENINTSPNNLIKSIRLKQAAYLLIKNKVNVSDVAFKVGFSSHSYFSNNFREYFGMKPTEFVGKYIDSDDKEAFNKLFEA